MVLGVVLRVLGQQRGRSSNRRRASPIDQCLRSSARECGTLPLAFVLFSFFFTLLSLADELLSAAARPVSRTCIGGENSLSASACKTLEPSKKKRCVQIESRLPTAFHHCNQPNYLRIAASDCSCEPSSCRAALAAPSDRQCEL